MKIVSLVFQNKGYGYSLRKNHCPVAQNQNPGSQCIKALPDLIIDQDT
jgi:hypothetical protein